MRRGFLIALVLAVIVAFSLLGADRLRDGGRGEAKQRARIPRVVAGRDVGERAARRVEGDGDAVLLCTYDGEGPAGTLMAVGDDDVVSVTGDHELTLRVAPGTWSVVWETEAGADVPLGSVTLEEDEVRTCQLAAAWTVQGRVESPDGRALEGVTVRGCNRQSVETDASGGFSLEVLRGVCDVQARWDDGIFSRRSAQVRVGAFDRGRPVVLEVDDAPIAGMGVGFWSTTGGMVITKITPDSPAEEAGLQRGDLIVKVDGTLTDGMADDAFVALGTGREGSTVVLDIERAGEARRFQFRRERIERADTG